MMNKNATPYDDEKMEHLLEGIISYKGRHARVNAADLRNVAKQLIPSEVEDTKYLDWIEEEMFALLEDVEVVLADKGDYMQIEAEVDEEGNTVYVFTK